MRERALVVDAQRWSVEGNTGLTLQVLTDRRHSDDAQGNPPAKVSGSAVLFDKIVSVPGIYELQYTVVSRGGRAGLGLADLRFVDAFELPDLGAATTAALAEGA